MFIEEWVGGRVGGEGQFQTSNANHYTPGNFYSDLAGKQIIKELNMIAGGNVTTQTPNRTSPVANNQYSTRTVREEDVHRRPPQ